MMKRTHVFVNAADDATIGRLLRSSDIRTINRFGYFEVVNIRNGHRYKVQVVGEDIVCSCPDAASHACKHEIAVARDIGYFVGVV